MAAEHQQYDPASLNSVYPLTNVAKSDLSNTTITANVPVTATAGSKFYTRSTTCANDGVDAYVHLELRSGPYSPSDYWWSTGANSLNLSTLATQSSGALQYSTANPAGWSNINGQNGANPAAGFADALKTVKQIGVGTGLFHLLSHTLGQSPPRRDNGGAKRRQCERHASAPMRSSGVVRDRRFSCSTRSQACIRASSISPVG